jgi:hypothetical protein
MRPLTLAVLLSVVATACGAGAIPRPTAVPATPAPAAAATAPSASTIAPGGPKPAFLTASLTDVRTGEQFAIGGFPGKVVLVIAIIIFAVVEGALFYSLYKYRAKKGAVAAQIHGNTRLEIGWTVGAALILVVLAVLTFVQLDGIRDPENSDPDGLQLAARRDVDRQPFLEGDPKHREPEVRLGGVDDLDVRGVRAERREVRPRGRAEGALVVHHQRGSVLLGEGHQVTPADREVPLRSDRRGGRQHLFERGHRPRDGTRSRACGPVLDCNPPHSRAGRHRRP